MEAGGNCTRLPTFWPSYCSPQIVAHSVTESHAAAAASKTVEGSLNHSRWPSVTGSRGGAGTVLPLHTVTTSIIRASHSTVTPTILWPTTSSLIEDIVGSAKNGLIEAASAPLSATALISAFSGVDPGAAQALLTTLQSPCMMTIDNNDVKSSDVAPRGLSVALSPLMLFGDEDTIGAFEVAVGNVGISAFLLLVHFTATSFYCHCNEGLSLRTALRGPDWKFACSKSAALLRFPSFSINFAVYLMPGVAWAVSTLLSSTTTRTLEVALGSAIGIGWLVCVGVLLVAVVLRRWILDREYGLTFCDFRNAHPFSPPIPRSIAAIICSRHGQWGPVGRRAAFGSPIATSFLPEHMRWMWAVSPLVSLLAVALNTAQPSQDQLVIACDAIQAILIVLFSAAALLFGWVLPHRSLLRSLLSCFSAAHNALVVLLGLLARHQRVEQDTVLVVAATGSYTSMVLGIVVVCIGFLEQRVLQRKTTVRSAPQSKNLLTDTTDARNHSGTIATMQREAALASLVAFACQAYNNEGEGDRLL
ncbi:transmembrane protein, putative [Bodo saltans]|uniref:Transmembrane protein, putative n=1 Tax=Bodo saltans TaxID=75058 RepID=A0A0S4JHU6_BODSA|nr:transmembrane protein, putative [Bodo saltans]|eukprot:CUG89859.1 transmembrane protein, putative [Bodo saltans]